MQVIDQPGQRQHLPQHERDGLGRGRADAVLQRFHLRAQHGKRRAQFVRCIGHPLLAPALGVLQQGRDVVEGIGQFPQFVASADRQARSERALSQRPSTDDKLPDRPAEMSRQHCRRQRTEQHADGGEQQQAFLLLQQKRDGQFAIRIVRRGNDEIPDGGAVDDDGPLDGVDGCHRDHERIRDRPCEVVPVLIQQADAIVEAGRHRGGAGFRNLAGLGPHERVAQPDFLFAGSRGQKRPVVMLPIPRGQLAHQAIEALRLDGCRVRRKIVGQLPANQLHADRRYRHDGKQHGEKQTFADGNSQERYPAKPVGAS